MKMIDLYKIFIVAILNITFISFNQNLSHKNMFALIARMNRISLL